jgi:hypothetical protein
MDKFPRIHLPSSFLEKISISWHLFTTKKFKWATLPRSLFFRWNRPTGSIFQQLRMIITMVLPPKPSWSMQYVQTQPVSIIGTNQSYALNFVAFVALSTLVASGAV